MTLGKNAQQAVSVFLKNLFSHDLDVPGVTENGIFTPGKGRIIFHPWDTFTSDDIKYLSRTFTKQEKGWEGMKREFIESYTVIDSEGNENSVTFGRIGTIVLADHLGYFGFNEDGTKDPIGEHAYHSRDGVDFGPSGFHMRR